MVIQIQSLHFDAGTALQQEVIEKLEKLEKLYDRIEKAEVTLKKEHSTEQKECTAEVRLVIPKDDLFAKESAATFAQALTLVTDDLKKQILKRKDKLNTFERVKSSEAAPVEADAESDLDIE